MKKFFGITEKNYKFEIYDLTALVTILNVALILCGVWFAAAFGIVNCIICCVLNVKNNAHINAHITQVALLVLNIYFLIG